MSLASSDALVIERSAELKEPSHSRIYWLLTLAAISGQESKEVTAPHHSVTAVSAVGWLSVAYMAVFSSVVSYLIYKYALSHIAASPVAAFSYLGGALVLAGIYVTERR